MEAVDFRVNIRSSKVYCAVARNLADQMQEVASQQGISVETLLNLWLQEKLAETTKGKRVGHS